jgi:hypothetical protein
VKRITVSVDDETYRRAWRYATVRSSTATQLFRQALVDLASEPTFEELAEREKETRARITNFSASDRSSRDELYDRARIRSENGPSCA